MSTAPSPQRTFVFTGFVALALLAICTFGLAQEGSSLAASRAPAMAAPHAEDFSSQPGLGSRSMDDATFANGAGSQRPPRPISGSAFQPFSSVTVAVKASSTGVGFDLATPIARRLGLRTGASYFSYNTTVTTDGLNIVGSLHLQNAATSLDIYPFHNGFRISPGLSYANHVAMNAALLVPGGQTFSFGDDGTYTSDPSNPVHGTGSFLFGNRVNPRITAGFANILSHRSGRFGMPVEVGFQYTAEPTVRLAITGNSCATTADGTGCGPVDQTSVAQEQQQLQGDLTGLRFYPLVSIGLSYKFGHVNHVQ